jgi:hypothetical protein
MGSGQTYRRLVQDGWHQLHIIIIIIIIIIY